MEKGSVVTHGHLLSIPCKVKLNDQENCMLYACYHLSMLAFDTLLVALLFIDTLALIFFTIFFLYWFFYTHMYTVPYVPSKKKVIDAMLSHVEDIENATILDLGSGLGDILIPAAKRGARVIGIEVNPLLVRLTKMRIRWHGLSDRATVIQGDFFEIPLPEAHAVLVYLLPSINERLRSKLASDMQPHTLVVSNSFPVEGWTAHAETDEVKVYRVPPRR